MTVVYIDSVFVLNALMDYLLLLATARLAGIPLRRRRYVLAGLLGGLYAAAVFFPGLGFLSQTPVKMAVGILLSVAAYGGEPCLMRLTLLLFGVSCGMAGVVLALSMMIGHGIPMADGIFYTDVNAMVLLITAAAVYLVLTVVFRAAARHGVRGELLPVRIAMGERTVDLIALADTGNTLRDPSTGRQVTRLTDPTVLNHHPYFYNKMFTADGRYLFYSRLMDEKKRLLRMDLQTGESQLLLDEESGGDVGSIKLSSDEKYVYFTSEGATYKLNLSTFQKEFVF